MKRAGLIILVGIAALALSGAAPRPSGPHKQLIQARGASVPKLPLSTGLLVGDTLYLSGAIGLTPSGQLVAGGFEPEMRQVLANVQGVLKAADMDFADVVSATVYLADIHDFPKMNQIYKEHFTTEPLPTRSMVVVKDLALGARVEITTTAVRTSPSSP